MIEKKLIEELAERNLQNEELFVVEVKISGANEIEVLIDSDSSVGIDDCIRISRAIESSLDREAEDFSLTVASAGIGQPLKVLRQFIKLAGKPVEIVLRDGTKITAVLKEADEQGITVCYSEKHAVEGSKKKKEVEVTTRYGYDQIKSTVEHLDFC